MRGMSNMAMMQKVQKLQKEMMKAQKALEETIFEKTVANDLLTVKMNGAKQVEAINIQPDLLDPEDADMLQDLLVATINELLSEIDKESEERLGKYTKGLNLPF